ncbi:MAG TPA: dual specificity protein phosphatase family protein [Planctomycetota bacterium]|nr:dual specificity protein phosphatase family protein [Planctomycetota bacterium]
MPTNFSFVIESLLAGMERPGTFARLREDLEFLKDKKIGAIVSLTESPLEKAFVEEFGFRYLHLPIADFTAPTLRQIDEYIEFLKRAEAEQIATVVHCGAGLGRTGTLLACAFVARGLSADAAIERVRELRPFSIETVEQEECIADFADILARRRSDDILNRPDEAK